MLEPDPLETDQLESEPLEPSEREPSEPDRTAGATGAVGNGVVRAEAVGAGVGTFSAVTVIAPAVGTGDVGA
jgi:hypothetical protein